MRTHRGFIAFPVSGALLALLVLTLLAVLPGCSQRQRGPAPLPDATIGVAAFTQPTAMADLLAGYIPEDQQKVEEETFADLDRAFGDILRGETKRVYSFAATKPSLSTQAGGRTGGRPQALAYWVEVGRQADVDFLLVPQVIDLHERQGGDMGVTESASIMMDVFLIDVKGGTLVKRSNYDEKQMGLADNLLEVGKFVGRKGKWLSALDLAREGMRKAVKEFGL